MRYPEAERKPFTSPDQEHARSHFARDHAIDMAWSLDRAVRGHDGQLIAIGATADGRRCSTRDDETTVATIRETLARWCADSDPANDPLRAHRADAAALMAEWLALPGTALRVVWVSVVWQLHAPGGGYWLPAEDYATYAAY
jgi:hypothetical protein